MKERLDDLMVKRGLAESKAKAQALIMAGKVFQGTQRLDKPGKKYEDTLSISVESPPRFVSRGGFKLEGFLLAHPQIVVKGALALDIGASTGGFTDCLLQLGAAKVVSIDVGHSQMHPNISRDPRVVCLEGLNARSMTSDDLPESAFDILVMDLAFISQMKVLENVWAFLKPGGFFISLIKPQFEVTKEEADKCQGVIKDELVRSRVVQQVRDFALAKLPGCQEIGFIPSPILGGEGNVEFLVGWCRAAL